MSHGVYLAKNKQELFKIAKTISRSKHYFEDLKDFLFKLLINNCYK